MGGAFLGKVPASKRCQARSRRSGERCKNPKAHNTRVCRTHGGASVASKAKAARQRVAQRYEIEATRYACQLERQGAQVNPVGALDAELRHATAMVEHYESLIGAALRDGQIVWGIGASELRAAGVRARDIPTIVAQQRGREHPAFELLQRERTHLLRLIRISLSNGVPELQREADVALVDAMARAMNAVVAALGHNPADREVRATVRGALASLSTEARSTGIPTRGKGCPSHGTAPSL